MVFRDQASSYRQLASESCDRGQTWTPAVLTDMPDSRAKQSAGNLPNGTAFLVNAPNADKLRIPLAVTLSADGRLFDRSFLLRGAADLQPLRYEGQYKRPGYHYPKSTIWNGFLYVAYATNKEDVEVTREPRGIELTREVVADVVTFLPSDNAGRLTGGIRDVDGGVMAGRNYARLIPEVSHAAE